MTDRQMRAILAACYTDAARSPDPSTQIGALLVRGDAPWFPTLSHNGFTTGWAPTAEDLERPRKYDLIEHAERSSLYRAARNGFPTQYCTMVSTWAACVCISPIAEQNHYDQDFYDVDMSTTDW